MTIKTKYDVGDKVWLIIHNKVKEAEIQAITIEKFENNINYPIQDCIKYYLKDKLGGLEWDRGSGGNEFSEDILFIIKEDLIKSL